MDDLQATYLEDQDEEDTPNNTTDIHPEMPDPQTQTTTTTVVETLTLPTTTTTSTTSATPDTDSGTKDDPIPSEELSDIEPNPKNSPNFTKIISSDDEMEDTEQPPAKKLKNISSITPQAEDFSKEATPITPIPPPTEKPSGKKSSNSVKKKKSKGNNVWTKPTSRKGKKRTKSTTTTTAQPEDSVLITPIHRYPDKTDDTPDMSICLSKVYKAEKVELSEDRMSAGSCKGYRMVRATRGVMEGAWYYEIKVVSLGETGHTRLGWSMEKGDLQAPVGYDGNSFGYRDIDGSKVHKALREKYGEEGYVEGDVIGFYINLPDGSLYAPKAPQLVLYKGQRYAYAQTDAKEEPPKVVPGSEICFFKNGICQGSAFKDLNGGRYYPAASMYTLPHQSNCVVKFNFGPDFEVFPQDFGQRPIPKPMFEVPYHGFDGSVQNGRPSGLTRACPMLKVVEENEY